MCEGRTIVIGKPSARYAAVSSSSQRIFACEYGQTGLRSGVDSVIGSRATGFWYADAELMKTYWPVRPAKRPTSAPTCSGVNARKLATTSNSCPPTAAVTAAASRMSAFSTRTSAGSGRVVVRPRLRTVTSMPSSTARRQQAALISPVPPMTRTLREGMKERGPRRAEPLGAGS